MLIRILLCVALLLQWQMAAADRIKDLASVAGVRANQLVGFGLVVGLQGSGDGADLDVTGEAMKSMLDRLGVGIDGPRSDFDRSAQQPRPLEVDNTAAVLVTAELPAFAKPGQRVDVNVSTIGKAESLRGGTLIMTRLFGIDGEVYAIAQGPLTVTGIAAEAAGAQVSIGVPTAGRIPNGALVERMVETPFTRSENVVLNLRDSDFSTATAVVRVINETFGGGVASALDGSSIILRAPADLDQRVAFISEVQELEVQPGEPPARVIINSRTGTVVINRAVRVSAAAVSHGTISVRITVASDVSQPGPFALGQTVVTEEAAIDVIEPEVPTFLFEPGVELSEIVDAVNAVGATPSSLIAILEALRSSGSLRADLVVI